MKWLAGRLAGPGDRWYWSADAFPPVSFCVHTLVRDGLAVPPFDRHSDGDGRLGALGLDGAVWSAWLGAVVEQRAIVGEYARTPEAAALEGARAAGGVVRAPGTVCPGSIELRARLDALFAEYAPAGEAWKREMSGVRPLGPGRQRALWDALRPFHARLSTLTVFLVDYVEPVVMALPPTTCLIAPAADEDGFADQVVAAAHALVAGA